MNTLNAQMAQLVAKQVARFYNGDGKISKRGMDETARLWVDAFRRYGFEAETLPPEVLKVFLDQFIAAHGCNSWAIRRSPIWKQLNIWPLGSALHKEYDLTRMENVLTVLDQAHYIYFQAAGSIWSITLREERE